MHRHDTETHQDAARHVGEPAGFLPPHDEKADRRHDDGKDQGKKRQSDVIAHLHAGKAEGEHGDKMHGPDAAAHRDRGGQQPYVTGPAGRRLNAAAQIQGRVRSRHRDQHGEDNEREIVGSGKGHR